MAGRLKVSVLLIVVPIGLICLVLAYFSWQADRRETLAARNAAPAGGHFVHAHDVDIFVQEAGPADGPPVLFLHGTGAWSETWRETLTALASHGFHVIAIDLPPFGFSQRPGNQNYSKIEQARRIVGVADALGLKRFILVGHSFGGGPTVEAALLIPDRIKALVLVDAALGMAADSAASPPPNGILKQLIKIRPLVHGLVAALLTNPHFTRNLIERFVANPDSVTPARIAVYQRPLALQGSTAAITRWLPELLVPQSRANSEMPQTYARLGMPVIVIWGALDSITSLPQGRRLAGLCNHGELNVLPEAGHIPQIETPMEFNALLLRKLQTF